MSDELAPRDTLSSADSSFPSSDAPTAPRRRGRGKKRYKVLTVVTASIVSLGLVAGLGATYFYRHLGDNIDYQDYDEQLSGRPPKKDVQGPQEPMNILVMGSDTREGAGNNIDGLTGDGERSDTTIMFHLSADRTFAYGISIPRDSIVDRPDCTDEDGSTIPGADGAMWNEAFAVGGPACTMQQFEQLTGIRLDNYVKVDFNGFRDMVDALDGVQVCIPEAIEDPAHGINIPAGTREVRGNEALNYVRARYTLGDGSDLGRVKRQQAFIAAMASKVVSAGTLTRVDRIIPFLDAATSSLQTDFDTPVKMARIGNSFKDIGTDKITFVTVPWQYSPADPNRVEWLPEADALWRKVINDQPVTNKLIPDVITAADDVRDGTKNPASTGTGTSAGATGAPSTDQAAARESAGLCA